MSETIRVTFDFEIDGTKLTEEDISEWAEKIGRPLVKYPPKENLLDVKYSAKRVATEIRYERVMDSVDPAERERIEKLRKGEGNRRESYGHDMFAAIMHGYLNRARAACHVAMDQVGWAGSYGKDSMEGKERFKFAMAMSQLINAAAEVGLSEEDIRSTLESELDIKYSDRIKIAIKRYGPK